MFYEMKIAGLTRQLPLCKVTDDLYIGAFIMFSDVEIAKACAAERCSKSTGIRHSDYRRVKRHSAGLRNGKTGRTERLHRSAEGPKALYDGYYQNDRGFHQRRITSKRCVGEKEADMMRGKRVLIVDDVISTGESLKSIETLVNQVGANIVGKMAVLAEGGAADPR